MVTRPRNRFGARPADDHPVEQRRLREAERREQGIRWKYYIAFLCLLIFMLYWLVRAHDSMRKTYPAQLKRALCKSTESLPYFVHCGENESHNRELLQYLVAKAANGMTPELIAEASATYALSLAMRTQDTKMGGELYAWMRHVASYINCYKLIDVDEMTEKPFSYPRSICAAAVYTDESGDNSRALEDFNVFNDLIQLASLYGSQFHESAIRYTSDVTLKDAKGVEHASPKYGAMVYDFYALGHTFFGQTHMSLLNEMAKMRNNNENERVGPSLLAFDMRLSLSAMARCQPLVNDTWRDYHARALRHLAEADDCVWAEEDDWSFWRAVWHFVDDTHLWYARRLLGRI